MQYKPFDFHPDVKAIFTTAVDGSIAIGAGKPDSAECAIRRNNIIKMQFGSQAHAKLVVLYGDDMLYTRVERVENVNTAEVVCDAFYTTAHDVVLMLSVADCVATLVYDPITQMLGILHLGRHSSVAGLIESFIVEVADTLGSDPRDWHVWMSPSLKKPHDRMKYFTPPHPEEWEDFMSNEADGYIHIDVAGHNIQRFVRAGVQAEHIYNSLEDTYNDARFFSQRAADEQHDTSRQGRMMLAASLIDNNQVS